jgi:hypothetical protein
MSKWIRDGSWAALDVGRPALLFAAWLFVGCSFVGLATVAGVASGVQRWLFLLGGVLIVAHVSREWFLRAGGDFAARTDDGPYILVTLCVLGVTLWLLVQQLGP